MAVSVLTSVQLPPRAGVWLCVGGVQSVFVVRDMDLIRRVLIAVEEYPQATGFVRLAFEGVSPQVVSYHVKLLGQARFLEVVDTTTHDRGFEVLSKSLTWEGHEFLDAIKSDTIWNRVKQRVADKGAEIPMAVLKELAIKCARDFFLS